MVQNNIDIQESLQSNLQYFQKLSYSDNNHLSIIDIVNSIVAKYGGSLLSSAKESSIIPLLDNSMQIDGAFFKFCADNQLSVETLKIDVINILPYADADYDPFVANGLFLVTDKSGFSFIKSSLIKFANNTESVSALTLLDVNNYEKYSELKKKYVRWIKEREGVVVKVVDGEEYSLNFGYKFDDLFFGEKKETKDTIKASIDKFYVSKDLYQDNDVPWNYSMLITGSSGNGKLQLIKTIISEYDLEPLTINSNHVDDQILTAAFYIAGEQAKSVLFIEDIDELIDQHAISAENLHQLLSTNKADNGMLVLMTCKKQPAILKNTLYIDKEVEITGPEYDKCVSYLFDKFLSTAQMKELQKMIQTAEMSYGYICKLHTVFVKYLASNNVLSSKKKDSVMFTELKNLFKKIHKEYSDTMSKRSKTKKIGLLDTK